MEVLVSIDASVYFIWRFRPVTAIGRHHVIDDVTNLRQSNQCVEVGDLFSHDQSLDEHCPT